MANVETVIQGQFKISADADTILSTVLGSCVSVCLFDDVRGLGGMNHYLLPDVREGATNATDMKYGALSMELLINAMLRQGALRRDMRAKLFGGARITRAFDDIGGRNADFARSYMQREDIQVVAESLGGTQPRRVHFWPVGGRARLLLVDSKVVETPPKPVHPKADITLF
ncbi:chemotaxis protein CheD [Wenxinia saemankumensis]|uniref:Probable chemoreceptor glutamine deamidase CheD n=1 Tax=Wenxinia saemankumensis TaxID=1447782 RepID=A0A1M6DR12_9RHOB|nr:chemotaxis protein CheD [Wenxinia saemankumensis]SHI75418.1 chemotaxis protein CheD [Wenxinia saemankumensis]